MPAGAKEYMLAFVQLPNDVNDFNMQIYQLYINYFIA
jgi:hypothetical protein